MEVESEDKIEYLIKKGVNKGDDDIILQAQAIIEARFANTGTVASTGDAGRYLQVLLAGKVHEVFIMLSLNNLHEIIACNKMFRGTIDACSVYPREIVIQALADGAAAVIFGHNHPSGTTEPSQADITITDRLVKALALVNIRVLDHVIVGKDITYFSVRGLI